MWAGIVLLTQYEIGWAAWGVGAAVGIAMGMATAQRSGLRVDDCREPAHPETGTPLFSLIWIATRAGG